MRQQWTDCPILKLLLIPNPQKNPNLITQDPRQLSYYPTLNMYMQIGVEIKS